MAHTCVEHSDFLKVDVQATTPHSQAQRRFSQNITKKGVMLTQRADHPTFDTVQLRAF